MHLVLAAADSRETLARELDDVAPGQHRELSGGMFVCDPPPQAGAPWPYLAFARQSLPGARDVRAASIGAWSRLLVEALAGVLPDEELWSLHVYPFEAQQGGSTRMGARAWHTQRRAGHLRGQQVERAEAGAGHQRCALIREATIELLQRRRRHLVRSLRAEPGLFVDGEALVQLVLTAPDQGFLSVALAPVPVEQRHVLSFFPGGEVAPAVDKRAPSRAFAKLVEAEARLARRISARDTCVDLGAAPGSWTYVAARRGAQVTAVDRAELAPELVQNRNVRFEQGDAFGFEPPAPVDWLLCDVIAAAERSAELLVRWLRARWCRQFVVTLKVDDAGSSATLSQLKRDLPPLTSELWLLRLSANKLEVCAFGTIADP